MSNERGAACQRRITEELHFIETPGPTPWDRRRKIESAKGKGSRTKKEKTTYSILSQYRGRERFFSYGGEE